MPPWSLVCLAVTVTAISRQYGSEVHDYEKQNQVTKSMPIVKRSLAGYDQNAGGLDRNYPAFEREMMSFGKRSDGFNRDIMSFGKREPLERRALPFGERHLSAFDRDILSFGKRSDLERSIMSFGRRRK
ncbi:hypothetical protein DICVIV_00356 [Dictyocaulus viviparus]|uniref:Uncharacterized protein n=1 Tax=Dictyocaulus viviparus TaxID=29172 RepID=A0A0D8Y9A5_DICVI|nr:hypothetical protein DICVIV_00356 [Dictyocaulus viviparus]